MFVLFAPLMLLFTVSAFAQLSGKGEITGRVTDPSGAVVPDATVVATSATRGTRVVTRTTSAGDYTLSPLDADTYAGTVTAKGFRTTTQNKVVVNALEVETVNINLTLGTQSENVSVTSAPEQLQTSSATLGATRRRRPTPSCPSPWVPEVSPTSAAPATMCC
jgi:hypothetical protein